jgi:hypothetical protein
MCYEEDIGSCEELSFLKDFIIAHGNCIFITRLGFNRPLALRVIT